MRNSRAKLLATVLIAGGLMALTAAGSASAVGSPLAGEWHRLNPSSPPEHELLRCVENSGAQPGTSDSWMCRYSKAPEPTLGFGWNNNYGFLSGRDITSSWSCPDWFPEGTCGNVVTVVEGTMNFVDPDTHQPPTSSSAHGSGRSTRHSRRIRSLRPRTACRLPEPGQLLVVGAATSTTSSGHLSWTRALGRPPESPGRS